MGAVNINLNLDTDGTLAANSDTKIASQKAIKTYVDAETTARVTDVNAEEAARIAADTTLNGLIGAEATSRFNADTTLQNNINSEATARANADALLLPKASVPCEFIVACSDLTTALTTGTTKAYFRAPYGFTLTGVRASLGTTQTSGSIFTVDINESGGTVLSTKLTIDNGEKTSTTAATPPVISDANIADDSEITIDIDQVGDGTAKGLIVTLIGTHAV